MIAIADYGMGNRRSVEKALAHVGARVRHHVRRPRRRARSSCPAWARSRRRCATSSAPASASSWSSAPPPVCRCWASASGCSCCSSPPTEHEGARGLGILTGHGDEAAVAAAAAHRLEPRARSSANRRSPRASARPRPSTTCTPSPAARGRRGRGGRERVRRALRLDRRARQRHGRPVPPREVLERRSADARNFAALAAVPSHDPLPGDRHHGWPGRPPGRGEVRGLHDLPRRPARGRPAWLDAGARYLHVVDLDGARSGAPKSLDHLRRIVSRDRHPGPVRRRPADGRGVRDALRAGAERAIIGTAAFHDIDFLDDIVAAVRRRGSSSPSTSRTA